MRELALFAGAGGGILGGHILGWRTVCAVEVNTFCRGVLAERQNDGHLGPFPIWDDVRTFRGGEWRGLVDVISGGFPCQDISCAGKGAGLAGERSGLWREFRRIIEEVEPPEVFIENSPLLRTRGLVRVLQDLAALGFNARWCVLGASDAGAPHFRKRMWIRATHPNRCRQRGQQHAEMAGAPAPKGNVFESSEPADADGIELREQPEHAPEGWDAGEGAPKPRAPTWWPVDLVQGVDDGVAHRVDRIRATGNGQVPAVAALAWETLGGAT